MNLLMKLILSILSALLLTNCESNAQSNEQLIALETHPNNNYTFYDFLEFISKYASYNQEELNKNLIKLDKTINNIKIHPIGNEISPICIVFEPLSIAALTELTTILSEEYGNPTQHTTYKCWRGSFQGKKILQFHLYYHPVLNQVLELKFRTHE